MDDIDERRLIPKPPWVDRLEARVGSAIPLHPHVLSSAKLLVVAPLLLLALRQTALLPNHPAFVLLLFALFAALDYLDGVVARHRGLATRFGRIYDRVSDYPMLFVLSLFCLDVLPVALVAAKLALDVLLLALFLAQRGSTENRLRTALSYTTLLALLLLGQGWAPRLVTPELVTYLLWLHIAFSSLVVLRLIGVLRARYLADALSALNLSCGVLGIVFAARGRFDVSLLFLILGAAFDGCDGAAARRFGGTRWGVYSDDVADAVSYALAPAVALVFAVGGVEGWIAGVLYAGLTVGRLVYFTLNKANADPNLFCGIPSTAGGLIVLCSLILLPDQSLLLGLMVGVACIQMISFDTHYRHLGRALLQDRRYLYGSSALLLVLLGGAVLGGVRVAVGVVLAATLVYGFVPTALHFGRALSAARRAVGDPLLG